MTIKRLLSIVVVLLLIIPGYSKPSKKKKADVQEQYPLSICFVREMEYMPELNGWESCSKEDYKEEVKKALVDWEKKCTWVETRITPELARELSRWAIKEMKNYKKVSPLSKVKFIPVRFNPDHRMIVLEGTIDTLPAHSPIVTRWLKIFLVYDTVNKEIIRATITIKGEILE